MNSSYYQNTSAAAVVRRVGDTGIANQNDYLEHFGIKGQKWGIRRYRNEDGTLTAEGRERYLSQMSEREQRIFSKMPEQRRRYIMKQMDRGMSYRQARDKMVNRQNTKAMLAFGGVVAAGVLAVSPEARSALGGVLKSAGRAGIRAIKNTNAAKRGALYMARNLKRRAAVANGATILKKAAYSVR